jgi:Copine
MDLMFAIDCSSTNRHWGDEKSLHFRTSSWMNDYQAAIKKIGTIFEAYDGKKEYTMWGYGAKVNGVYHPYFVMGDRLNGAASLLKAYDDTFSDTNEKNIKFTAKAELSHIVQTSMYRAIRSNQATRQCYSTLVILSTGEISDLQETVDAVCAAAEDAPLSIVVIGVGATGNFERLQRLNGGDFGKLRHSNGVPIARDIVHFVKFSNFRGNANRCVSESLKEIPEQFVQHFLNAGIRPLSPKPIPDFSGDRTQPSCAKQGDGAVGV